MDIKNCFFPLQYKNGKERMPNPDLTSCILVLSRSSGCSSRVEQVALKEPARNALRTGLTMGGTGRTRLSSPW